MQTNRCWWLRQLFECIKEVARQYSLFEASRDVDDFDKAWTLSEDCPHAYNLKNLDLLDFVEIGKDLPASRPFA